MRGIRLRSLLVTTILITCASGCATQRYVAEIHPIEKTDIFSVPKGAVFHVPAGTQILNDKKEVVQSWSKDTDMPVEKTGWFLSDLYMGQVMKAKAERAKQ